MVVLGGGLWYAVKKANEPPELEPALAKFRDSWNAGDVDGMVSAYRAEARDRMARSIRRNFERRDWESSAPQIEGYTIEQRTPDQTVAHFPLENGALEVHWTLEETGWRLIGIGFPKDP